MPDEITRESDLPPEAHGEDEQRDERSGSTRGQDVPAPAGGSGRSCFEDGIAHRGAS